MEGCSPPRLAIVQSIQKLQILSGEKLEAHVSTIDDRFLGDWVRKSWKRHFLPEMVLNVTNIGLFDVNVTNIIRERDEHYTVFFLSLGLNTHNTSHLTKDNHIFPTTYPPPLYTLVDVTTSAIAIVTTGTT
jgi:hypothetical protein